MAKSDFWEKVKPGLFAKIIVALLLVGLIPLGLVSYQLIGLNRRAFTDQVLFLHVVAAEAAAFKVESFVSARMALARGIAENQTIYLDPRSAFAQELLADLLTGSGDVRAAAIGLYNPAGEEIVRAQQRQWAELAPEMFARGSNREELKLLRDFNQLWLYLSLPLPRDQGGLRMIFSADQIPGFIKPEELGTQANILLAERGGTVLAGSLDSLEGLPDMLVQQAETGRISGSGKYARSTGGPLLGAYAPVPRLPLYVISTQPVQVAQAIAFNMRRRSLLAVGLALALVSLLAGAAYRGLVKPIRQMIDQHRGLTGAGPGEGDEISRLKASFLALESRLKDKESLAQISLGRYQIQHLLGEGAMGSVFKGYDPRLRRPVALKTLRFSRLERHTPNAEMSAQLLQEAITAARISHPNVVGVYDVEDTPEVAFVTMEFVDGQSLEDYLRLGNPLPPSEVIALSLQIAMGLAAAHEKGIVHHDIKPGNILLGRDSVVKLADFGISRFLSSLLDNPNKVFGTPGYLPPETLRGDGFTMAGDCFALGVVMYRCLTGVPPFAGSSLQEIMRSTMMAAVIPPHRLARDVTNDLSKLVMQLLEKIPEERLSDAAEIARRLEEMAAGERWVYQMRPFELEEIDGRSPEYAPIHSEIIDTATFLGVAKPRSKS